jgi:transaldolase
MLETVTAEAGAPVTVDSLTTKIFADGADLEQILQLARNPLIRGFTTNPSLMWKAGLTDYADFAQRLLERITTHPISFEVFADEADEMRRQAKLISDWGPNVYVKIPVTNTRGEPSYGLIRRLAEARIKLNVTAILTLEQVREVAAALAGPTPSVISVFAGRIADTGRDPVPLMAAALELIRPHGNEELLWASPRELLNLFQADAIGCHIITATNDVLKKLALVGKDLAEYSLDTVRMFHDDARHAGYTL